MSKEMFAKRYIKNRIRNCNFEFAKQSIINQFSGTAIPNELARRLDNFVKNPCVDTALELIKFDPDFVGFFELARNGGITEYLYRTGHLTFKKNKEKGPRA